MSLAFEPSNNNPGYGVGMLVLLVASATILAALGFEYIGGHIPCPLCLQQRWAYYAAIPVAFGALVLIAVRQGGIAAFLFFLIALAFLANAGLGVYQSGAEWGFWPGPDTCAGAQGVATNASDLLGALDETKVIRCDQASWRLFGLSFAGWNALVSLALSLLALQAATSAARAR